MATTGGDFDYKQFRKEWDNLCERQQYKEAEKLCHEGLAKSPQDQSRGRLYNHLGFLYENFLDDKTFDDILEHYVLSLQVDESNANSHYNLANFLLEQGMQHLLRALELNPNHSKANVRYANLTPIKANTTLSLDRERYQVIEVIPENGVRATRLIKRDDGQWERSNDAAVQIGISSPQKVVSSGGSKQSTSQNAVRAPFEVSDNKFDDDNDHRSASESGSCCYRCVFKWYFWSLLWLIAIGGITCAALIYFELVGEAECTQSYAATEIALNSDTMTQGKLNILFVVDCGATNWEAQFVAANELMNEASANVDVWYDVMQYCDNGFVGNESSIINTDFIQYTATLNATNSGIAQANPTDATNTKVFGALDACQQTFDTADADDSTPFLCLPFVAKEFDDSFAAMSVTADVLFSDIYLAFMVSETDTLFDAKIYSVLGSFGTGTECIARMDDENAYGNTWWETNFDCDSTTMEHSYCPHCIRYDDTTQLGCATNELANVFSGDGVTEISVSRLDEECVNEYDEYLLYCVLAGFVPLLFWVFVSILVLCCNKCRNSNRSNMERAINEDDRKRALV